jgi:hypothetical protein
LDPDPYPVLDPLRQKVPDLTGSGSTTLVFKTVVSAIKFAPTDTSNPDGVPDCILSLEAVTLFAQLVSLETGALLTCLSLRASSLSFVIKKYSWLYTLIKKKIKFSSYKRKFRVEQLQSHI